MWIRKAALERRTPTCAQMMVGGGLGRPRDEKGMTRAAFVRNFILPPLRSNESNWQQAMPIYAAKQISYGIESSKAKLQFLVLDCCARGHRQCQDFEAAKIARELCASILASARHPKCSQITDLIPIRAPFSAFLFSTQGLALRKCSECQLPIHPILTPQTLSPPINSTPVLQSAENARPSIYTIVATENQKALLR